MEKQNPKYLIIETEEPVTRESGRERELMSDREILYAGEGGFDDWREKLNGELNRGKYYLTQIIVYENKDEKSIEIATAHTFPGWLYQFPHGVFNTVKLSLTEETKGLIKKIIGEEKQEQARKTFIALASPIEREVSEGHISTRSFYQSLQSSLDSGDLICIELNSKFSLRKVSGIESDCPHIIFHHKKTGSTIHIYQGNVEEDRTDIYGENVLEAKKVMEELARQRGFSLKDITWDRW